MAEPDREPFRWLAGATGWPDKRRGPYFVSADWLLIEGRPECVGVRLWKDVRPSLDNEGLLTPQRKDIRPLRAADLKAFPLATVLAELWRRQQEAASMGLEHLTERLADPGLSADDRHFYEAVIGDAEQFVSVGGRQRLGPGHYQEVAEVYLAALASGDPPTEAVRKHFVVSHSMATKYVSTARNVYKLLAPTTPGSASRGRLAPDTRKRKR